MYTVATSLPLLLCSNIHFQKMFGLKNIHTAAACSDNVPPPPCHNCLSSKIQLVPLSGGGFFLHQKEAKVPLNLNCRWDQQMDINLHVQCASQLAKTGATDPNFSGRLNSNRAVLAAGMGELLPPPYGALWMFNSSWDYSLMFIKASQSYNQVHFCY